jgi:hypothetical protein
LCGAYRTRLPADFLNAPRKPFHRSAITTARSLFHPINETLTDAEAVIKLCCGESSDGC